MEKQSISQWQQSKVKGELTRIKGKRALFIGQITNSAIKKTPKFHIIVNR